ncbi:hypothetical protein SprV_0702392600 [Sparganum proliferum]
MIGRLESCEQVKTRLASAPRWDNGAISEAVAVANVVKQGCVLLAPTLFSLMFSAMLMDAYCDERPGYASPTELTGIISTAGVCRPKRGYLQSRSTISRRLSTERHD